MNPFMGVGLILLGGCIWLELFALWGNFCLTLTNFDVPEIMLSYLLLNAIILILIGIFI